MRWFTVSACFFLILTLGKGEPGQAIEQFFIDGQKILINGLPGSVAARNLTSLQLEELLEDSKKAGWEIRTNSYRELSVYQLTKENRQLQIFHFPRTQKAIISEVNRDTNMQKELLAMLHDPPGKLKLSFAAKTEKGICLIACFDAQAWQISNYRTRLRSLGWERWFSGNVELWQRETNRLGISQKDNVLTVWLLTEGGKTNVQF